MTLRNKQESILGIELCHNRCIVCGWDKTDKEGKPLVIGAHVYPFANNKKEDNYMNIIPLCPNHHIMFDRYLFYIDPETRCLSFVDKNDEFNGLNVSDKIKHIKKTNLSYRKYLFDKNQ